MRAICFVLAGSLLAFQIAEGGSFPRRMLGMPLIYVDRFESGRPSRWEMTDPAAWKVTDQSGNRLFSQHAQSKYSPPVRSPLNRALVRDLVVSDFVMEVRLQSTVKDYGHRDLCLFFGYQDPAHLYYVHLGKEADPHAHSIFLVNGVPRASIAMTRTSGIPWDDGWHTVRIVRKVASGSIEVFFDDMSKPIMTAADKTFLSGQVGIGSFDDTGNFDDIRVWGLKQGQ